MKKDLLDRLMPDGPLEIAAAVASPLVFLAMKLIYENARTEKKTLPHRQISKETIHEDLPAIVEEAQAQGIDTESAMQVAASIFPNWKEKAQRLLENLPGHARRFVEEAKARLRPTDEELLLLIEMSKSRVTRDLVNRVGPGNVLRTIVALRHTVLPPGTAKRLGWALDRLERHGVALA